ncbi:hypothetical protein [Chitinophaga sp. S165]|uniref:hypothetical protein n=1 Tax=Chitinophaga sp. S165 TaxID=2135462 RepID=UPI000D70BD7C|nr:hypothetical protein [Chitinophaga sp. S165]PWV44525.1 hypothetical protein C7475_1209 [Chitinophaga sp. S165]
MLKIPNRNAGIYAGLLNKITSYQDRLLVRYVLEKLLVVDSQCAAIDGETIREYLSNRNIQLLLVNNFIVRHETTVGVYYELSSHKLISEMEEYASNAPNKELFDNEPLTQTALKAWRKRQELLEYDQDVQREFIQLSREWEMKRKVFLHEIVVPLICITIVAIIIFVVTHFIW